MKKKYEMNSIWSIILISVGIIFAAIIYLSKLTVITSFLSAVLMYLLTLIGILKIRNWRKERRIKND
ncbi:hypothetical protein [Enterococcus termitis]|uniref:Uncharacterized protein n=1 Tax=Enterococcus termitis TaxID=332950 RepID=A0A1E5H1A4_9ENTE|nr:hypothetical protein [Enterococcus termitis]OEG18674.1 hypothetical protein BCR25_15850 [Enterococcus termitis]